MTLTTDSIYIFCVCFDVMYSSEYNVFDVTLSVYPQAEKFARPRWESNRSTGIPKVASLIPTVARPTFQPAQCGYTLRVTSKTLLVSLYFFMKFDSSNKHTDIVCHFFKV